MKKVFTRGLMILLVFLAVSAFSASAATEVFALTSEDEAELEIQEAEARLSSAFVAVLEAEKNGADVSDLLARLNSGGGFLAEARTCYRNGDFDGAVSNALLSVQSVEGLVEEVEELKALAIAEYGERSFLTMTGSGVAVVVIVLGSVVVWLLFKRRYLAKVLEMKPEVVEG